MGTTLAYALGSFATSRSPTLPFYTDLVVTNMADRPRGAMPGRVFLQASSAVGTHDSSDPSAAFSKPRIVHGHLTSLNFTKYMSGTGVFEHAHGESFFAWPSSNLPTHCSKAPAAQTQSQSEPAPLTAHPP